MKACSEFTAAWEAARASWPDVEVSPADFARFVGARAAEGGESALVLEDLFLTCAACAGDQRALRIVAEDYLAPAAAVAEARYGAPGSREDFQQQLSEYLLSPQQEGTPRLGKYSGRGNLHGWVKVVAARLLWRRKKQEGAMPLADEGEIGRLAAGGDPELAVLKERYAELVAGTLRDALGRLPVQQRNLLRYHFMDRLTCAQLSSMYGVTTRTVDRRLLAARKAVAREAKALLAARLQVASSELDTLVRNMKTAIGDALVEGLAADRTRA